ncbi:hypothetical protein NHX12_001978 [Muraenolepis orangiensis]|uniref:Uncharacterized protein n=1 Tax=Muraenolepis orangiensis TaxID=630683 RepID=A0A9Q0IHR7_9TELE|nr:hypothetical protein NHX12_001978 [Muraenolepis orangiensis]
MEPTTVQLRYSYSYGGPPNAPPPRTLLPPASYRDPSLGVRLALKAIWTKNSGHLTASQQEQLWELLREFKDSFALGEGKAATPRDNPPGTARDRHRVFTAD